MSEEKLGGDVLPFFDPHFHLWSLDKSGVRTEGCSPHDASILCEGDEYDDYDITTYEASFEGLSKTPLLGGVFVEAISVCFPAMVGEELNDLCIKEAEWALDALTKGSVNKQYRFIASACLEAPNALPTLEALAKMPGVVGIRQILNRNPNWPRNGADISEEFLLNETWCNNFGRLQNLGLIFDMQINPCQYKMAAKLLNKYPSTCVVLNHLGCMKKDDLGKPETWAGLEALASHSNMHVKLSMLAYADPNWEKNEDVLKALLRVIEIFGINRCFFSSNLPVEARGGKWTATALLTNFVEIAVKHFGEDGAKKLLYQNAMKCYGLNQYIDVL